ncbi:MAG: DegT/DnrJ/EryC1/StrS family aminotransferase [Alphaproteobacteria bacterium]
MTSPQPTPQPTIEFAGLKAQQAALGPAIAARMDAVLRHGQYIMGPEVAELESALAAFAGARQAVALSSGTDALVAAMMALSVGAGDAVFLPSFTFPATAEAPLLLGATPVFVDVDPQLFTIDPADLAARVEAIRRAGRLRPRMVIAVDLFGLPADYDALAPVAEAAGMTLLADAAQSFGASVDGRRVGTLTGITATSFFPAKPLGCFGDGGALFTDDAALADRLRSIRAHGRGAAKYDIDRLGLNARLDTLQAAVLLAKLPAFAGELAARERLAASYDAGLADAVVTPARRAGAVSAWAQYTILSDRRDALRRHLEAAGIPSAVYYPRPTHLQPAYRRFGDGPGSLPVSEALCARVLSLPMHGYLSADAAARVIDAVRDAATA